MKIHLGALWALQRAEHLLFVNADTLLEPGDQVVLITGPANLDAIRAALGVESDDDAAGGTAAAPMV